MGTPVPKFALVSHIHHPLHVLKHCSPIAWFWKKSSIVLSLVSWYHLNQCVQQKERLTTGTTAISHTRQELLQRQEAVFSRIPGISALRRATPEDIAELEIKYPDAAFALMISDNLFVGDRELNEIHQKAYTAILRGESIPGVRFRYDYDTESYLRRHMWD